MYFKTLGFNTCVQAGRLANDLKIGHYMKVSPRIVFFNQILGTVIGCVFNYLVNVVRTRTESTVSTPKATGYMLTARFLIF